MNGVLRDAVRMSAAGRVLTSAPGYPLGMSEQWRRTVHNLHVTPDIASARGIGAATGRGGNEDASGVSKGTDRGGN